MTTKEVLLEKFEVLSVNRQQELLDFAEFLESKEAVKAPRLNLHGVLADLNINITEEDICEARKEAWANFPREHFFDKETK